ncbi:S1C family serine protease [Arenimonas metalli]|uniref:S1C family serine protease n=1 Tax=Arenimonas metalli TaxID=948077 RepID=UPI001470714B|nr:serine protease [Arenimonas metalli]
MNLHAIHDSRVPVGKRLSSGGWRSVGLALVILLGASPKTGQAEAPPLSPVDLFKTVSDSVVTVRTFDNDDRLFMQGSGVVIGPGLIVSNCHVFKDSSGAVALHRGQTYQIGLLRYDLDRDVCTFSAKGLTARPVVRGSTQALQIGQRVYAVGAPHGLDLTLSDGLLSAFRSVGGLALLQTTAQISPGSSGGGLFDETGKLIGITTSRIKDSGQLNFAVPVEWIAELEADSLIKSDVAANRSEAVDKALLEVRRLGEQFRSLDPENFALRLQLITPEIRRIQSSMPPEKWASEIRRAYLAQQAPVPGTAQNLHFGELRTKEAVAAAKAEVQQTIVRIGESDPNALELLLGPVQIRMEKVFALLPPSVWAEVMSQIYQQVKSAPQANQWTRAGEFGGANVAIDAQAVVRSDLVRGFFVRRDSDASVRAAMKRHYTVSFIAFDCVAKEMWTTAEASYGIEDQLLEADFSPIGQPRRVDDASGWAEVLQLVCE